MKKPTLKIVSWSVAVVIALVLGIVVGGGAVYAFTQNQQGDTDITVDVTEPGLLVAGVVPDSPAAQAGIKRGDIILKIDEQAVNRTVDVLSYLADLEAGQQVQVTLMHGDEERDLTATLTAQNDRSFLGIVPCGAAGHRIAVFDRIGHGAAIIEVVPDSPAAQAGLQVGDRIVAVNGQEVGPDNNLGQLIAAQAPGDVITLTIERANEAAQEIAATLGENPNEAGKAYLGINYRPFPRAGFFHGRPFDQFPFDRDRFFSGESIESAIIVRNVAEGSPAEAAGLIRGDVITAIDGQAVENPGDLADAAATHQPGDTLTLTVTSRDTDESREVTVTLGENPNEAGKAYLGVAVGGFFRFHRNQDDTETEDELNFFFDGEQPFDFSSGDHQFFFEGLPFDDFHALPFEQFDFEFESEQFCDDAGNCTGNAI